METVIVWVKENPMKAAVAAVVVLIVAGTLFGGAG